MPSRNKKSNRKKKLFAKQTEPKAMKRVKSPRRKQVKRSLRFTPKFVIRERVDTIEDTLDTVLSKTERIPRDVANIIAEYEDFDDGRNVEYWHYIPDGSKALRSHMKYKIMPAGNGLVHHQEWYPDGKQKTDCYYDYQSMQYHGDCKQWNENGFLVYDRTFKNGEEKIMSKITGKGSKINLYKVHDEYDD